MQTNAVGVWAGENSGKSVDDEAVGSPWKVTQEASEVINKVV
jgi:hypothetical protein